MFKFVELHDADGPVIVNLHSIVYFYKDPEDNQTYISMTNGTSLRLTETVEELKEAVEWL
jgi:hypothetical protein